MKYDIAKPPSHIRINDTPADPDNETSNDGCLNDEHTNNFIILTIIS